VRADVEWREGTTPGKTVASFCALIDVVGMPISAARKAWAGLHEADLARGGKGQPGGLNVDQLVYYLALNPRSRSRRTGRHRVLLGRSGA
jgi:hypothetical protein